MFCTVTLSASSFSLNGLLSFDFGPKLTIGALKPLLSVIFSSAFSEIESEIHVWIEQENRELLKVDAGYMQNIFL